jgi:hypothetical protein
VPTHPVSREVPCLAICPLVNTHLCFRGSKGLLSLHLPKQSQMLQVRCPSPPDATLHHALPELCQVEYFEVKCVGFG